MDVRRIHRENLTRQAGFARDTSPLTATMLGVLVRAIEAPERLARPEAAARFVERLLPFLSGETRTEGPWVNSLEPTLRLNACLHWYVLVDDPRVLPLRPWFHTVGGTLSPLEGEFESTLLEVVDVLGDELIARASDWHVYTNETSRGLAWLLPAVLVGAEAVAVVEIGATAGLNLYAEQRRWDLRWEDEPDLPTVTIGQGTAPQFRVAVRGARLDRLVPPLSASELRGPEVVSRTGCAKNPVDLRDPAAEQELAACVWGDQPNRLERLREGMAAHRRALHGHGRLARLEQAELPDDLGEFLVKAVPPRSVAPVVCVNTFVTAFLPDVAHRAVFRTMSEFAKGFTVRNKLPFMWVRFEPPRAGDADPPHPGFCRWQVEVWDERAQHRRVVLGWAHPHLVRMELGEGLVELRSLRRQDA